MIEREAENTSSIYVWLNFVKFCYVCSQLEGFLATLALASTLAFLLLFLDTESAGGMGLLGTR